MPVDRTDAWILRLVQENNRLSSEEIGEVVGRSPTTVTRRLQKLRGSGVISADVSVVSAKAVGLPVEFIVLCTLDRDSPEAIGRFVEALRCEPHVTSAYMVTGETDFIFTVVARTLEEYQQLHRYYRDAFPGVRSITSLAVLEPIKRATSIPVEPDGPDSEDD